MYVLQLVSKVDFTDLTSDTCTLAQIFFCATLLITAGLYVANGKGAILIGISITTVVCWFGKFAGVSLPFSAFQMPTFAEYVGNFAFREFHGAKAIGMSVSFTVITLFDVAGAVFGVLSVHKEMTGRDVRATLAGAADARTAGGAQSRPIEGHAHQPDVAVNNESIILAHKTQSQTDESVAPLDNDLVTPFESAGVFATVGAGTLLGCSPCIVFLECVAGVASGARTGAASSLVTGGGALLAELALNPASSAACRRVRPARRWFSLGAS